jgi:hypothetical protein
MTKRHPTELDWARRLSRAQGSFAAWRHARHVAGCVACREKERALREEQRAFDAEPRRRQELAALRVRPAPARAPAPGRSRQQAWPWMLGATAAVGVVAMLRIPAAAELRAKGGDRLALYVERAGGAVPLAARCAPGDRLIARARSPRPWLLLLERDGRGAVQVLYPQDGRASARAPGADGTTPQSFVLDAVPGRECFAAFFSDEPLEAAAATAALAAEPERPALAGASVRVQCCEKGEAR